MKRCALLLPRPVTAPRPRAPVSLFVGEPKTKRWTPEQYLLVDDVPTTYTLLPDGGGCMVHMPGGRDVLLSELRRLRSVTDPMRWRAG